MHSYLKFKLIFKLESRQQLDEAIAAKMVYNCKIYKNPNLETTNWDIVIMCSLVHNLNKGIKWPQKVYIQLKRETTQIDFFIYAKYDSFGTFFLVCPGQPKWKVNKRDYSV